MADININMDAECKRCGKGGATDGGLCLSCIAKAIKKGEFDHSIRREKPKS